MTPPGIRTLAVLALFTLSAPAAAGAQGPPAHAHDRGVAGPPEARGAKFCRTGAGHPVFGRRWCLEKGFGLGGRYGIPIDLGGVIFDSRDAPVGDRRLGPEDLARVLGPEALDVLLSRLQGASDRRDLAGRWVPVKGAGADGGAARVLELRASGRPVAELNDLDGDGRVDKALLYRDDPGR